MCHYLSKMSQVREANTPLSPDTPTGRYDLNTFFSFFNKRKFKLVSVSPLLSLLLSGFLGSFLPSSFSSSSTPSVVTFGGSGGHPVIQLRKEKKLHNCIILWMKQLQFRDGSERGNTEGRPGFLLWIISVDLLGSSPPPASRRCPPEESDEKVASLFGCFWIAVRFKEFVFVCRVFSHKAREHAEKCVVTGMLEGGLGKIFTLWYLLMLSRANNRIFLNTLIITTKN